MTAIFPKIDILKAKQNAEKFLESSSNGISSSLQPVTPPVISPNESKVTTKIGNYILLNNIEGSTLKCCKNIETGKECAYKVVPSSQYNESLMGHFRLDSHPHINSVQEVIVGKTHTYIIYPGSHGDLHTYIRNKKRLRESEAISLFLQVAQAVTACHEAGIVLRDLKLRKFVFKDSERKTLKLETLDDAVILDNESDDLSDKHGCPAYVSPEILTTSGCYSGKAADCWSLGVMLYAMLVGRYPFHDNHPLTLFTKIRNGTYSIPTFLPYQAKNLICSLLQKNPSQRLSAAEVLVHPWFKSGCQETPSHLDRQQRNTEGNDAKVPDQTVPDLTLEENSSLFT